jgi:hypothetical protein
MLPAVVSVTAGPPRRRERPISLLCRVGFHKDKEISIKGGGLGALITYCCERCERLAEVIEVG